MKIVRVLVTVIILFAGLVLYLLIRPAEAHPIKTKNEHMNAATIIKELGLTAHPEGGYFKETYRSAALIPESELGENYSGDRNVSTCIYFLLTSDKFSAFHKINQDEIWHYYKGTPLLLHIISSDGEYSSVTIGNDFSKGEVPQYVVKGGDWFAAEVIKKNGYTLVGCTVAPGFDFADFVLPERTELIALFPEHEKIITQLTHH